MVTPKSLAKQRKAGKVMSVVSIAKLTEAEEMLFSAYDERAEKSSQSDAAIAVLKANGLPTRRVESWHYTDLRSVLKNVPAEVGEAVSGKVDTLVGNASLLALDALSNHEKADFRFDDAIGQLNGAFATSGSSLNVGAGEKLESPKEIQNAVEGKAAHTTHTVSFADKSSGTVIERQLGEGGFATSVTNLKIGNEAEVSYIIVQGKGVEATHLGQINVTLGADANFTLFVLNTGGKLVRQEIRINVAGEGSDFQLRGVNLIGDGQHIDVTMDLCHNVPNTTSEEIIRNVVTGKGKGVFQGRIAVAQIAQKTDAKMACNTLLLSDEGDFSTKPELEIFADDVACGHGATFTDLEPSYLFYLMSRGIPEKEARALLIKGFVDEIVEDLDHEALEEAIVSIIDSWLDQNG